MFPARPLHYKQLFYLTSFPHLLPSPLLSTHHLIQRLPRRNKQHHNHGNPHSPHERAQHRKTGVVLKNDVDVVVEGARRDVGQRQRVHALGRHARGVAGHDGGRVQAERLEAVGGGRFGAGDAAENLLRGLVLRFSGRLVGGGWGRKG